MKEAEHKALVDAKIAADEYRKIVREAAIEYLKKYADPDIQKATTKAALKEFLKECLAEFGWLSFKTLAAAIIVAYFWTAIHTGSFKLQ